MHLFRRRSAIVPRVGSHPPPRSTLRLVSTLTIAVLGAHSVRLSAQLSPRLPRIPPSLRQGYDDPDATRRSGPRFGFVYLGAGLADSVTAHYRHVNPIITLFGWESQYQIGKNPGGPQPLTSLLVAAGGLDQGVFLPSLSWIIGMRMPSSLEFGVGPTCRRRVRGSSLPPE